MSWLTELAGTQTRLSQRAPRFAGRRQPQTTSTRSREPARIRRFVPVGVGDRKSTLFCHRQHVLIPPHVLRIHAARRSNEVWKVALKSVRELACVNAGHTDPAEVLIQIASGVMDGGSSVSQESAVALEYVRARGDGTRQYIPDGAIPGAIRSPS